MKFAKVLLSVAAATCALPASAAIIQISGITPEWVNPLPVAGITISNAGDPITVRWGVPDTEAGQSGYNFDDTNTPPSVNVDTDVNSGRFLLGTLTHLNNPVFEPVLASIGLKVTVNIVSGVPGSFTEIFSLFHNETTNGCSPLPSCANDIVTFGAGTLNSSFTVGTQSYVLSLIGFSNNGGTTLLPSFSSPEGGSNSTQLWARIAARPTQVPEPATLLLMGAGLLSVAFLRRRKQR